MKVIVMKVIAGILIGPLIATAALGIVLWTGSYNVAATNLPGMLEARLAVFAVKRAVRKRAPVQANPLVSPEDIRDGLEDYKRNCLDCHGARGTTESAFSRGLNPPAPDLTLLFVRSMGDGELYWIVSNGVRMTGMPAFSPTHSSEQIWKIVAFVRHMPEMNQEEQELLKAGREERTAEAEGAAQRKVEQNGAGAEKSRASTPSDAAGHED